MARNMACTGLGQLRYNTVRFASATSLVRAAQEVQTKEPYASIMGEILRQAYPFRELQTEWLRWVAISSNDPGCWGDSAWRVSSSPQLSSEM